MKITIDFTKIIKSDNWSILFGLILFIIAAFAFLYLFAVPLTIGAILFFYPDISWFNSVSVFWKTGAPVDFFVLNAILGTLIFVSFLGDLLDESDWTDADSYKEIFWVTTVFYFGAQEYIFRDFSNGKQSLSESLVAFALIPTFLFLIKTTLRRLIQLKSKLNSNAEMLRELTRTDEELRLKILEKKLEELNK